MPIECTTAIACTPEHLWPFLAEPELQKQWMKGLEDNRPTSDGPRGVGSTFQMHIKEGGRVAVYDGEVTAHDPPRHLGVRFWGGALRPGMAMRADYHLSAVDGQTRLDYVAAVECKRMGFFMRLLMPLFMLFGRMQLKAFLKTLKRLAEEPR
jgi:carbon monoxide dehydrogenase subunit G